jgi:hypothetical protein
MKPGSPPIGEAMPRNAVANRLFRSWVICYELRKSKWSADFHSRSVGIIGRIDSFVRTIFIATGEKTVTACQWLINWEGKKKFDAPVLAVPSVGREIDRSIWLEASRTELQGNLCRVN